MYAGIFAEPEPSDDEFIRGETEQERIKRLQLEKEENAKIKKWNWFQFLYRLTGGDILKFNDVLKLNIIFVFNFLAFEAENKKLATLIRAKPTYAVA